MESVDSHYINISNFRPLLQTSYIKLPVELRGTKRALINIKNNDLKCFIWCHISNINLIKIPPEMIIQKDKEIINDPDYKRNKFAVSKKNSIKIETKNKICINVFCFENKLSCLIYVPDQKFENSMDLLRISSENKSHCEYIKDFDRFWFNKTRNKNKKYFCKRCLHCFSNKNV